MLEFSEFWKMFLSGVNLAAVVGFAVTVLLFVLEGRYLRKKKERPAAKVKKAIEKGRVVTGVRTKAWDDGLPGEIANKWHHGNYRYSVNGVNYEYRYMGKTQAPSELRLYYGSSPKKAFSEIEENSNPLSILAIVLPIAVGVTVTKLLGSF